MTKYLSHPVEVFAFQWKGEPRAQWPQWAQDYTGVGEMGAQALSLLPMGTVLVIAKYTSNQMNKGDWVVSATGKNDAVVVPGHRFAELYQEKVEEA